MGEKRKALKYIFTFTSTHRGLERNLSRSAFFMSLAWLPACLVEKSSQGEIGTITTTNETSTNFYSRGRGKRRGVARKRKASFEGKVNVLPPPENSWPSIVYTYLALGGEGNTKRCAKVHIQCKTQIQKAESHYRHPHLRTLDLLFLLELTLATTNTNTSSTSDQNMSTVCVLVTFFEVLPQNVQIKSTFTWDCNATVFF